jgi:hypothetical protein
MSNLFKNKPQQQEPSGEGHRDYEFNLDWSKKFIKKVEAGLPKGVRVAITSSHHFPNSLLMISWTPPRNAPIGNFAVPIFMHTPTKEFINKSQTALDLHVSMALNYIAKHAELEVKIA